jgi:hypothetical protein
LWPSGQVLTGIALRVGGEPEREVVMCAGEALRVEDSEEVRVLLGPGCREAAALQLVSARMGLEVRGACNEPLWEDGIPQLMMILT